MNEKIKALGEKELRLIFKEVGISKDELLELDEEGLMEVYDVIFDIELEEELKNPNKMSERGILASNILTAIGD